MTQLPPSALRLWPGRFLWGLKVIVALAFLFAAFQKFVGQSIMVKDFEEIGLGQGFRYLTAAIEGLGAILLLWPQTVPLGAFLLLGICAGALVAQIGPLHGDVIHVFVLGALTIVIGAWDWTARRRAAP